MEKSTQTVKGLEIRGVVQSKIQSIDREIDTLAQQKNALQREPIDVREAQRLAASDYIKGEDKKLNEEYKQIQADRQILDKHEKKIMDYGKENGLDKTLWRHAPSIFRGEGLKYYEKGKANIEPQRNALDKREEEVKAQALGIKEQLRTREAQEFIRQQAERHLKLDQERQQELEKVSNQMKELSEQKQQLQEFNKNISPKTIDKLYTIEGDPKDLANLLNQADSIQMQSAQHVQQQHSLRTSISTAKGIV